MMSRVPTLGASSSLLGSFLAFWKARSRARISRIDPTATLDAAFFRVQNEPFVQNQLPERLRPRQLRYTPRICRGVGLRFSLRRASLSTARKDRRLASSGVA